MRQSDIIESKFFFGTGEAKNMNTMEYLKSLATEHCACGRAHRLTFDDLIVEEGAMTRLPEVLSRYGTKAYILCDRTTYRVAGERVCNILKQAGFAYLLHVLPYEMPEPDETAVGSAVLHFDTSCDVVLGVGSGVVNDISKILCRISGRPYVIFGTAPSMDGYASATSSMARDGLKVSVDSVCPNVIVGDLDILCQAPAPMLQAGLGDMLAKFTSICEWRISHLINGEYYCEDIARLVRKARNACVENASKLMQRDKNAVKAVFEGLVIGGVAMSLAGLSRPASGAEHYFSHLWDMRGLEFHTPVALHGIQCAVATVYVTRLLEQLSNRSPDRDKALAYVKQFDVAAWHGTLKQLLGKGADAMIALEQKEGKYSVEKHAARLEHILEVWDEIRSIIREELLPSEELEKLLRTVGAPGTAAELGQDETLLPVIFAASKDLRDKYVVSRLCWDLGLLDEMKL